MKLFYRTTYVWMILGAFALFLWPSFASAQRIIRDDYQMTMFTGGGYGYGYPGSNGYSGGFYTDPTFYFQDDGCCYNPHVRLYPTYNGPTYPCCNNRFGGYMPSSYYGNYYNSYSSYGSYGNYSGFYGGYEYY